MTSKGKPSPRLAMSLLSDEQVKCLAVCHMLADSTQYYPTGPCTPNQPGIDAQNPKITKQLLGGVPAVFRASCKTKAWGLEQVPETGPSITTVSHITIFDMSMPMVSLFHMGRHPRCTAKVETVEWPLIGKWFQSVGIQPVRRRSGKAKQIEEVSTDIPISGRPLTV